MNRYGELEPHEGRAEARRQKNAALAACNQAEYWAEACKSKTPRAVLRPQTPRGMPEQQKGPAQQKSQKLSAAAPHTAGPSAPPEPCALGDEAPRSVLETQETTEPWDAPARASTRPATSPSREDAITEKEMLTSGLLGEIDKLLTRAHDESQRKLTGGPTGTIPSLLTPRFDQGCPPGPSSGPLGGDRTEATEGAPNGRREPCSKEPAGTPPASAPPSPPSSDAARGRRKRNERKRRKPPLQC